MTKDLFQRCLKLPRVRSGGSRSRLEQWGQYLTGPKAYAAFDLHTNIRFSSFGRRVLEQPRKRLGNLDELEQYEAATEEPFLSKSLRRPKSTPLSHKTNSAYNKSGLSFLLSLITLVPYIRRPFVTEMGGYDPTTPRRSCLVALTARSNRLHRSENFQPIAPGFQINLIQI